MLPGKLPIYIIDIYVDFKEEGEKMNVLLIDSSLKNKHLIENALEELAIDCTIQQIAGSFKLALRYLSAHSTDLVIFQTELEDLPGYVFFKKIRESYPSTATIMVTNTQYSDYVDKALQEGLTDFMYNPLRRKEIIRVFKNVHRIFQERQNNLRFQQEQKRDLRDHIQVFQDRFLMNLIHSQYEKELDIVDGFQYFNLPLSSKYCILIMKIDHFKEMSLVFEEEEKELMLLTLLSTTQSVLENTWIWGVPFMNRQDSITLILGAQREEKDSILLGEKLREEIEKQADFTVTIGIGRIVEKAKDIHVSYKQAKAALRHQFYLGDQSVIHINYVEPNNLISYNYPLKKEELLVFEIVNGNEKTSVELLNSLFEALSNKSLPHGLLPKIILDIMVSVNRTASEQGIELEKFFSQHVLVKEIREKDSLEEAYKYSKQIILGICSFVQDLRKEKEKELFQKSKEYIHTFYHNPLSLKETSFFLQTTPKYLNQIFIQEIDVPFSRYVEQVRIDHSKKLLLTNEPLDSIAVKVGFQNAKYFTGLFEQIEGVSPHEYRKLKKYENRIVIPPIYKTNS